MDPEASVPFEASLGPAFSASQALDSLIADPKAWKNIQDIVRATMQALAETVKRQESLLVDMQQRHEDDVTRLYAALGNTVRKEDLRTSLSDIEKRVDVRVAVERMETLLEQKVTTVEVQGLLRNKANAEEVLGLLEHKADRLETEEAVRVTEERLWKAIEELHGEQTALQASIQQLEAELATKASAAQLSDGLAKKANSDSVASFLKKKASREDLETGLSRKADLTLVKDLVAAVERKADQGWLQKLASIVEGKAEKQDVLETVLPLIAAKPERRDLEEIMLRIKEVKTHGDRKNADVARTIEVRTNTLSKDVESIRSQLKPLQAASEHAKTSLDRLTSRKADMREVDELAVLLERKADMDDLDKVVEAVKDEVAVTVDSHLMKTARAELLDDVISDIGRLKSKQESLQSDFHRFSESQLSSSSSSPKETIETTAYIRTLIASLTADLRTDVDTLRRDLTKASKRLERIEDGKADKGEVMELSTLRSTISGRADTSYVDQEVDKCRKTLQSDLQAVKDNLKKRLKSAESGIYKQLETRISIANPPQDSAPALSPEQSRLLKSIANKADQSDLLALIEGIAELRTDLSRKVSQSEFSLQLDVLKHGLDQTRASTSVPRLQELCALVDSKASKHECRCGRSEHRSERSACGHYRTGTERKQHQ